MIYLLKNNTTDVTTDNISTFAPINLDIYLDDVFIVSVLNSSNTQLYIKFELFLDDTFEQREYIMKIYSDGELIKKELVVIGYFDDLSVIEMNKQKEIKMYE